MKRALTAAEMRAVDAASPQHGMTGAALMENAGEALATAALAEAAPRGRFFVLCGPGNNGGDGFVVARKLLEVGRSVFVELTAPPEALKGDAAWNFARLEPAGLKAAPIGEQLAIGKGDVVIDALLGTGLSRPPQGAIASAIERINAWRAAGARVVAADLPSGLSSDDGQALEPCVRADVTLSFGFLKLGQALEPGEEHCGRTQVVDIGIPRAAHAVLPATQTLLVEEGDVRAQLPRRRADAHKGSQGHVLLVAGSHGKTGAAALAALGALRGGAGLVTVAARGGALDAIMHHAPEIMGHALPGEGPLGLPDLPALSQALEGKSALVVGPGIARGGETGRLVGELLAARHVTAVLDADALNAIAGDLSVLRHAKARPVLTPHPGEMARLCDATSSEIQRERLRRARDFATEHRVVLALKGARTLVAKEDGTVFVNPTGNPGMATGGTGDVLAGLCGALLAQGLAPDVAALCAVYVHGLAGDLAALRRGQAGLIASDLLEGLGEVWSRWGL